MKSNSRARAVSGPVSSLFKTLQRIFPAGVAAEPAVIARSAERAKTPIGAPEFILGLALAPPFGRPTIPAPVLGLFKSLQRIFQAGVTTSVAATTQRIGTADLAADAPIPNSWKRVPSRCGADSKSKPTPCWTSPLPFPPISRI